MLGKGHFLSQTGQCKVWDAGADGYCRGDGVGSVVIKRLEDAIEDNDHILATIVAGATNHSSESVSITQPHAGVQKDNYQQVMNQAGVSPLDVNFVELHGTGTQVGDAIESESVLSFFAPVGQRQHPEQRLHLGAVKSNIGHGEAAAGVASLIKVLLMYRHGQIPRHVGIQTTVNPVVAQHLANRNAGVVSGNTAWLPMPDKATRYSIVNSFGAHGGNTTLLLEDAPSPSCTEGEEEGTATTSAVICVSAKSKASLRGNVSALLRYVDAHPEIRLKDLAYTTCARRMHHHIRIAASVSSTEELRSFLKAAAGDVDAHAEHVSAATPEAVVFAFSGQGCFYRGAAAQLFEKTPFFRDQVLQLDRVVRQLGFPSVLTAIANVDVVSPSGSTFSSDGDRDYNFAASIDSTSTDSVQVAVESPIVTQLALVVLQIALARYWGLLGIVPKVVIGHSLGEYAALVMADVLSVADALFLVGKRAELMIAACTPGSHTMLSVRGASADRVSEVCHASGKEYDYEVSCLNGRADIVLSGTEADMIALCDVLQGVSGLKCAVLDIPFAFHSAQLEPILDDFQQAARRVTFKVPRIPVVSPLLGQCISEGQIIDGTYLRRATREPVDFVSGMNAAAAEGLIDGKSTWMDIGPHPVCTSFTRNFYEGRTVRTLATMRKGEDNLATLTGSLAALHSRGLPIAWTEYFAPHEKSHRLLHLDSYHWNQKNYWIPYEGTWTLDKAHAGLQKSEQVLASSAFLTSSVQQVIFEEFQGTSSGRMTALSDLTHPDLVGAAAGHKINGQSVITGVRRAPSS
jgi:asperthecin polyketide synthase